MLIVCQECRSQISDKAERCPRCGADPETFSGGQLVCSECRGGVTRAHSKCPHCGAPASLFSGSTIERNTHRSDRIGAENQLSAYYTKDGSAVVTTDNELAYSFKRFVQRTIAVIQALILLSALMLAAALSIQAHQEYSYSGVGAYFSSEY